MPKAVRILMFAIFLCLCREISSSDAVLLAASLARREVEGKGKGVIAQKAFAKGDCILREKPIAYALSAADNAHMTHCHVTLLSSSLAQLQRCQGCNYARYASREDQRAAWPSHKRECKRIARCIEHGHTPSSLLLLLGRLLDLKESMKEDEWNKAMHLQDRYGDWSVDQMSIFAQTAYAARDFMGRNKTSANPDEEEGEFMRDLVKLQCRVNLNAFTLVDDDLRPVGLGLYPVAALFNHDCAPNCIPTMHGTTLQLRACRDIPAGAEVVLSYVDEAEDRQSRRAQLLNRYLFNCSCTRCELVMEPLEPARQLDTGAEERRLRAGERVLDLIKMGLSCPRSGCAGWLAPWSAEQWASLTKRLRPTSSRGEVALRVEPFEEVGGAGHEAMLVASSWALEEEGEDEEIEDEDGEVASEAEASEGGDRRREGPRPSKAMQRRAVEGGSGNGLQVGTEWRGDKSSHMRKRMRWGEGAGGSAGQGREVTLMERGDGPEGRQRTAAEARREAVRRQEVLDERCEEEEARLFGEVVLDAEEELWLRRYAQHWADLDIDVGGLKPEPPRMMRMGADGAVGGAAEASAEEAGGAGGGSGDGSEQEVEEVMACVACGATVAWEAVEAALQGLKRSVGAVRALRASRHRSLALQRRERILAGAAQDVRLVRSGDAHGWEEEELELHRRTVRLAEGVLHRGNLGLLRLREGLQRMALRERAWGLASREAAEVLAVYRLVYPPMSPVLGMQEALLGKIKAYQGGGEDEEEEVLLESEGERLDGEEEGFEERERRVGALRERRLRAGYALLRRAAERLQGALGGGHRVVAGLERQARELAMVLEGVGGLA